MSSAAESESDDLLAKAAAGDRRAVDELLALNRPRLKQVISVRLDRRLAARVDPSDVVQETLAEAARRMPEFLESRPLPFFAWLRQIAWNRLVDLYRFHLLGERRAVGREVELSAVFSDASVLDFARRLTGGSTSPSRQAMRQEARAQVREALARLPEIYREALVLRHLEQLSIAEIAAIAGVSEGAVKSRLFRGMEQLEQMLGGLSPGTSA